MMLILIISVMLYYYIKITIYESLVQELSYNAQAIVKQVEITKKPITKNFVIASLNDGVIEVEAIDGKMANKKPYFKTYEMDGRNYLVLYHSYTETKYLRLSKDATFQKRLVDQILIDIIAVSASTVFLLVFYALFLSRMLLVPVKLLSSRIIKVNEHFLTEVDLNGLPKEFQPLGKSINKLIGRIKTFVGYQKELFIGIAHELKTPLAVMKTKNEVTLIKQREPEKYIEALKSNNDAINSMNSMISSILEIGRQEGAQFEEPKNIDLIKFLKDLGENLKIVAHQEKKQINIDLNPDSLIIKTQPTLLTHIMQNFVQNAIKFSPEQSTIHIKSNIKNNGIFLIEVIDEGQGIDESKDLFAPFKRFGNKPGAGLGLFLAKGAAEALGATIDIKNRTDGQSGAVATLKIYTNKKGN